jgi:hypothetical protein
MDTTTLLKDAPARRGGLVVGGQLVDMEELAEMLAYRLPLQPPGEHEHDPERERCIRLTSLRGRDDVAELVVRKGFVRMNLSKVPEVDVLAVSGLEEKPSADDRFEWAAEVRPKNALGARLLLEVAVGLL